ncbi:PaaX family transcriptional regulator [Actinomadura madurae]|uniref:PaaX family transcriptional regulator n=1 Tax=Actinomadura madurae TaxID=1993 RepID=UPI0020D24A1D|nr:hypothetical protein [Actinomadura madurae]MCQ0013905.1 hypothetical protein [Actinomadura madurae]
MARTGEDAARPEPRFRRRRELGAASARSLLLTVLGEFVLPGGRPVWTATFLRALGLLGVEEKAVRQALARSAGEGWLAGERHGRRTAWRLTPAGERLLTDGTERIYGFGGPVGDWDGRWLVVLATVPETSRRLRHLLRTRLAWNGLGNLSPGVWVSPHPEREQEVREVLAEIGVAGSSTLFVGRLGDLDEARRVARQAWDLNEIELAYEDFLDAARRAVPRRRRRHVRRAHPARPGMAPLPVPRPGPPGGAPPRRLERLPGVRALPRAPRRLAPRRRPPVEGDGDLTAPPAERSSPC